MAGTRPTATSEKHQDGMCVLLIFKKVVAKVTAHDVLTHRVVGTRNDSQNQSCRQPTVMIILISTLGWGLVQLSFWACPRSPLAVKPGPLDIERGLRHSAVLCRI